LSQELPIMFEVADPSLIASLDSYIAGPPSPLPINILIEIGNGAGVATVRWEVIQFVPYGPSPSVPGFDGRTRYTFGPSTPPDRIMRIQRTPTTLAFADSLNPAVDRMVSPLPAGRYPRLETVDAAEARFSLVYDFVEAGSLFEFVSQMVAFGTSLGGKRDIRIDVPDFSAPTVFYQGCFIVKFEALTGFGQDIRLKERITLDCDFQLP
jgi:hypothetical protein